ncbi:universal stress protein [Nocardioides sp.]|uniref:universal stress protein n=1 Tax=Nocardioides sp. TaxID=35761 RepID=UPI003529D1F2
MIGRILLAVDDSAPAFAAADLAIELAQTLTAELRAVTVAEEGHLPDRVLGAVASRARRAGVRVETVTLADGMPPFELTLAEADRWGADLVVMGRSDQRRLGPAYVGSQTSRLLEFAEIPVLVVPGPAPG